MIYVADMEFMVSSKSRNSKRKRIRPDLKKIIFSLRLRNEHILFASPYLVGFWIYLFLS